MTPALLLFITHLHSLPVSGALVALVFPSLKRLDVTEDEVRLRCHGDQLPAVVTLSLWLVRRCPPLSVAQGDVDLSSLGQQLNTAEHRRVKETETLRYGPTNQGSALIK